MKQLQTPKDRLRVMTNIEPSIEEENLQFYGWDMDDQLWALKMAENALIRQQVSVSEQIQENIRTISSLEERIKNIMPTYPILMELGEFMLLPENSLHELTHNSPYARVEK